jgi:hypothetical protein
MLLFGGFFGVVMFVVWLSCIVDVITTPAHRVRSLPKLIWLLAVVLLVDVGAIAWLVFGRPWGIASREPARVGARSARPGNPDDDEEFLAGLQARIDEQKKQRGDDA